MFKNGPPSTPYYTLPLLWKVAMSSWLLESWWLLYEKEKHSKYTYFIQNNQTIYYTFNSTVPKVPPHCHSFFIPKIFWYILNLLNLNKVNKNIHDGSPSMVRDDVAPSTCVVPFSWFQIVQASSRKTGEIPPVKGTSTSLFREQCKLKRQIQWSMKIPL